MRFEEPRGLARGKKFREVDEGSSRDFVPRGQAPWLLVGVRISGWSTLMSEALAIDVRGMTKRFGARTAVDHIDLQVRAGEICGFLGPNGSGKTTFIRMLCGLLRPDAGSGTCLGHDVITESDLIKRAVGYMTQRFSFWDDLTIAENL